jgi:hypothetical protein
VPRDIRESVRIGDRPALEQEVTGLLVDEQCWTVISGSVRVDRDEY